MAKRSTVVIKVQKTMNNAKSGSGIESSERRWKWIALTAISVASVCLLAAFGGSLNPLKASRLAVVNNSGKEVIVLGVDENGDGFISVHDGKDYPYINLSHGRLQNHVPFDSPTEPAPEPEIVLPADKSLIPIKRHYVSRDFMLTLTKAEIKKPEVNDLFGDTKVATSPDIVLTLKIQNTNGRKILRYREANEFIESDYFGLTDDVENTIRGISYGMGTSLVGALSSGADIDPGKSDTHVVSFKVPPPQTKYLILKVNLKAFGSTGDAKFIFKSSEIHGF